jgi:hypothetical protein
MVYAIAVLANDEDGDGGPLIGGTVDPATLDPTSYEGGTLTLNPDGTVTYEPPTDWVFDDNGEFTDYFEYFAVDSDGDVSEEPALVTITLINQDPVATNNDYDSGHNVVLNVADFADGVIELDSGYGVDFDPDNEGDPYDPVTNPDGWSFQDELTVTVVNGPDYGTLDYDSARGTFTYIPSSGNPGTTDSFTYTLSDNYGGVSEEPATVTINLSNTAPVANPDFYDVDQNTTLIIPVVQGTVDGLLPAYEDYDPDNEGDPYDPVTNPDGWVFQDELTAKLDSGTTPGTVAFNEDGSFTYDPPAGWVGTDTFTYYVTDGYDNSDIVQVTITVLGTLPVAPLPVLEQPIIGGCPVLMDAVASELGVTSETIQVSIGIALTLNPGIQPCDACASLVDAIAILRDPAGTHMAAMMQVFDTLAPANVPFTPEMAASIATAFADNLDNPDMPQYATAMEYVDAFVEYIAVLDTELGSPVDDSVALVMEKYGAPLTESDNPNIGAYIAARLAAAGM